MGGHKCIRSSECAPRTHETAFTGKGGPIDIDIAAGATVDARGEGSIGILAQSSGDKNSASQINITVEGAVIGGADTLGGTGTLGNLDAAAIMVSGGDSNQITIAATGSVQGRDKDHNAIVSMYGMTNVDNHGSIIGSIMLGTSSDDPNLGVFTIHQGGSWVMGPNNVFSNNSVHNYGLIEIVQPTEINGSLKHYADGEIVFRLDPSIHFSQSALTVTGLARIDGKITPVLQSLLPGEFRLLKAGSLEGDPQIDDPLVFDWLFKKTSDGELRLSAQADFAPAGLKLSANEHAVADYLQRAWDNNDPHFGRQFGYMLGIQTAAQQRDMLSGFDAPELLHNENASLRALPTLLGEVIDCPRNGGADVIVSEGSCAWMQGGQSWGRYEGNDTPEGDVDGDLYSIGVQRELAEGWFVGGVFGRLNSDVRTDGFRGTGHTNVGGIGLKHQSGRWLMGASLAYAKGSYDSLRRFELPVLGGAASAVDATLSSDSEMDVTALRLRASYAFGSGEWYLHPAMEVDLLRTDRSGFEEKASVGTHPFLLRADAETRMEYAFTPHVEVGMQRAVGKAMLLRTYVDAGVRLAPDADREIAFQVAGANSADGWFRNRIDAPLSTGLLKVGAQLYREDALDLRLEYGLEANGDFRNQSATARLGWNF